MICTNSALPQNVGMATRSPRSTLKASVAKADVSTDSQYVSMSKSARLTGAALQTFAHYVYALFNDVAEIWNQPRSKVRSSMNFRALEAKYLNMC